MAKNKKQKKHDTKVIDKNCLNITFAVAGFKIGSINVGKLEVK